MTIEPFKPEHLAQIDLQEKQTRHLDQADEFAKHFAYTARAGGEIIACAGIVPVAEDVGMAWSFLSRHAGRHFLALHRAVLRGFALAGFSRLIASTECDFAEGCRWLELLGFQRDETLEGYGRDGRDHFAYVRVC